MKAEDMDKWRLDRIKDLVNRDDSWWLVELCERLLREKAELQRKVEDAKSDDG